MKLELEFGTALCYCSKFIINDIFASEDDFGDKYDNDPNNAEPYGCGDMRFFPKLPTQEALDKYKITVDEYQTIVKELESGLSFGKCGWCV